MPRDITLKNGAVLRNIPDDLSTEEVVRLAEQGVAGFEPRRALELPPGLSAAASEANTLEEILGAPVATGGEALGDLTARFSQARLDTITDKVNALQKSLPGAQIRIARGSFFSDDPKARELPPTILVKMPGEEKFVPVDSGKFERGDIADIVGTLTRGDVLAPLATFGLTRGIPGALGAVARAGAEGVAAGAGRLGQEVVDPLLGVERDLPGIGERLGGALDVGTQAAGFGLGGEAMSFILGSPGRFLASTPRDIAAINARMGDLGQEIGLFASDSHPIFSTMFNMATRTSRNVRDVQLRRLEETGRTILRQATDITGDFRTIRTAELQGVVDKWETALKDSLKLDVPLNEAATPASVGRMTQQALREFEKGRRELVQRAKIEADEAASARSGFDVSDAKGVALEAQRGIQSISFEQLRDEAGKFTGGLNLTQVSAPLPKQLQQLTDDILNIRAGVRTFTDTAGRTTTGLDQMLELRQRAANLRTTGDPTIDGFATKLYNALDEAVANPTGNRRYRSAVRRAVKLQDKTNEIFDKAQIRALVEQTGSNPATIGRDLIIPGHPDRIRYLRAILQAGKRPDRWERVRAGFFNRLLQDPTRIPRVLSEFDTQTLRSVMSTKEQQALTEFARSWTRLQRSSVQRLIDEQQRLGAQGMNVLLSGTEDDVASLIAAVGGKESDLGKALRAGLIANIYDRSVTRVQGRDIIRPKIAKGIIQDLEQTGKLQQVLTARDLERLDSIEKFLSYIPDEEALAAGLQATEAASGFFRLPGVGQIRAGMTLARNSIVGRMIVSDLAANIFTGSKTGPFLDRALGTTVRQAALRGRDITNAIRVVAPPLGAVVTELERDAQVLLGDEGTIDLRVQPGQNESVINLRDLARDLIP